jgi:hypothetical protein
MRSMIATLMTPQKLNVASNFRKWLLVRFGNNFQPVNVRLQGVCLVSVVLAGGTFRVGKHSHLKRLISFHNTCAPGHVWYTSLAFCRLEKNHGKSCSSYCTIREKLEEWIQRIQSLSLILRILIPVP